MADDTRDFLGTLIRDGGGFALRADDGRVLRLDLHRTPIDEVEKRVRVRGVLVAADRIDADGVALA